MLRLLAGGLILFGSAGFSFKLCQEMRQRMRHIEQMQEIFRLFQSEVAYSRASFPEVCMAVSDRIAEPFRTVMKEIYAQVMEKSGVRFPEIWRTKMGQCLENMPLKEEERNIFLEFGNRIGFIDWETQAGMIEKSREQLEELYVKSKSSMENKEKMITSIGILGGLMLVIILI